MKKILYFASMMLAVFTVFSCTSIEDNPAPPTPKKTTTTITLDGVNYEADVVATFKGEVGQEVSLTLGVYDPFDIYGVDFGDGKIVADTVCYQNGGLKDENGMTVEWRKSATTFSGTVAGEGAITVYGKSDVWYLIAAGGVVPTSLDQEKLKKVVQMKISGAVVDAIDLNGLEDLEIFGFSQGSLGSLKCAGAPKLKDITVNNNTASKFESVLTSIDVTQNPELESLNLMAASAEKSGKLTSLDLSKNPKLSKFYAQYNKISEVKLPAGATITFMNLQNNEIESIDLSGIASLKDTYLNNNKLKTVDLSKLTAGANLYLDGNELTELVVPVSVKNFQANNNKLTKVTLTDCTASCKLEDNCLTLATLPTKPASLNTASKIKKFTYSPQADMEVTPENAILDLSAQATAQGIEAEPQATVFAITAGDAILEANKDYKVENGKITFLANFNNVIVKMTNAGFPNLTLATKPFNVTAAATETSILYALNENDAFTSGQTIQVQQGVVSITYGEAGGADFKAAKADSQVEGYTAFTEGNGTNGNKTGGTFYTIKPEKNGTIEVAVVLNADKAFYIEEDGTALEAYNGIKTDAKYYGTYSFAAKAGKSYKVYCAGSKLGFYGFKFTY